MVANKAICHGCDKRKLYTHGMLVHNLILTSEILSRTLLLSLEMSRMYVGVAEIVLSAQEEDKMLNTLWLRYLIKRDYFVPIQHIVEYFVYLVCSYNHILLRYNKLFRRDI